MTSRMVVNFDVDFSKDGFLFDTVFCLGVKSRL